MSIARRERFLHWEAAFPGVWRGWQDHRPEGGFDAVIGNPPWDRIKPARGGVVSDPRRSWRERPPPPREGRIIRQMRERGKSAHWPPTSTPPRSAPTSSAGSFAHPATIPCWAAATSTSTRSSSSAP